MVCFIPPLLFNKVSQRGVVQAKKSIISGLGPKGISLGL